MTQPMAATEGGAPGPDFLEDGTATASWPLLAETGSYLGGALILGFSALALARVWYRLGTPSRVTALTVPALMLAAAAVAQARSTPGGWRPCPERDPSPADTARRRRVSLSAAAAAVLAGSAVAAAVIGSGAGGDWAALAGAWTGLAATAAAYLLCRADVLHTVLGIAAGAAAVTALRATGWYGERSTGWAFVALGAVWAAATVARLLTERGLGFGWSAVLMFLGAELLITAEPRVLGYAVLAVMVGTGLAGFALAGSLTLLMIGAGTLAALAPQSVLDAERGGLGPTTALLVVGLPVACGGVVWLWSRRVGATGRGPAGF